MPARAIRLSYRSHITGRQPFIPGGTLIGHESTLERDFVTLCRFDPDVLGIEEQPITINWIDPDGRNRRYTPDYLVVRQTGVELVEIKYRDDLWTKWADYKPAFAAAREWAAIRRMRFRIVTDRHIRGPLLSNTKRLIARMHDTVPAEIERDITVTLVRLQPISLSDLVEAVVAPERPREVVLSALWPLLARRTVITALDTEINGHSLLSLRGALP